MPRMLTPPRAHRGGLPYLLLLCLCLASPGRAQDPVPFDALCNYDGTPLEEGIYAFPAGQEAETAVDRILQVARLPQNFTVQAANVPTVAAVRHGDRRRLLYNQLFLRKAQKPTAEGWAALRVLAHEVGHHLLNHTLAPGPHRPLEELEADDFSGYVLARLRAPRRLAVPRPDTLAPPPAGAGYPAWALRHAAVQEGWSKAGLPSGRYYTYSGGEDDRPKHNGPPGEDDDAVPAFPWPPPRASAFATVPSSHFGPTPPPTYQALAARLEAALEASGYGERSYYAVPEGFALVARLEQIHPDGTPKDLPDRWSMQIRSLQRFSLVDYFKALFTATPGYYRIVVFVVSARPFTQEDVAVGIEEGTGWLGGGLNTLPPALGARPVTAAHRCTALIYAFERPSSDAPPAFRDPSPLTGRTHLEKARLWNAFRR